MKEIKFNHIVIAIMLLITISCTDNQNTPVGHPTTVVRTLNVNIEQSNSRSVVYADGSYQWLENDRIGVYGSETSNAEFMYINNDGSNFFKGELNSATEEISFAYYPYRYETICEGEQLHIVIPSNRPIDNSNPAPMIGYPMEGNEIYFTHLGAVLFIRFVGLPDTATRMVVTSIGADAPLLSGTAIVDNVNESQTFHIEEGLNTVTFDLASMENKDGLNGIHIPLQVGNYEKISLTIYDDNYQVLAERSLSNIEAHRAHLIKTPILNFSDELYAFAFPDEWIEKNLNVEDFEWDAAYYLSNDNFIYFKELPTGILYHHMNFYYTKENGVPWFHYSTQLDSLNRPVVTCVGDIMYVYNNYTETTYDKHVYHADGTIEDFTGLEYKNESRSMSRHSADGSHETMLNINQAIQTAGNIHDVVEYYDTANDMRDFVRDYKKEPNVNDIMRTGSDCKTVNIRGMGTGLAVDAVVGVTQISSSAVTATVDEYREGREKNTFSGTSISVKNVFLKSGNLNLEYAINGQLVYDEQYYNMGFLIRKLPIGTRNTRDIYYYSNDVERIISSSSTTTIPYESGYTYYIRPFIKPITIAEGGIHCDDNTIMPGPIVPFTPMPTIMVDNHWPEMEYRDGNFHFTVEAQGYTEDVNGNNYMIFKYNNFYKLSDRKNDVIRSWNNENNYITVDYTISPKSINFKTEKYPSVYVYGSPVNSIINEENEEGYWPKYTKTPSLTVTKVEIQPVGRSTSRALFDDNEDETYEDNITVNIATEGTGLIEKVWCTYSKGGTWAADAAPTDDGQTFRCSGSTNKYSEKNGPGTVSVKAKLRNGSEYTVTTISFLGTPITSYQLNQ